MGTYVNVYLVDVRIPKDKQAACLETLHKLLRDTKHFDVKSDDIKDNLTDQLDWFGFSSHDNGEDIELEEYTYDKSGDEEQVLNAIAPFAIPGGYVSLKYEDDASFGWTYEDDPENGYMAGWSTVERTMSDKYRIERVGFTLMDGEKIYPLNIGREQILKLVNLLSEEEFGLDKEIKEKLMQIAADRGL